jgi:hypothetical protein
MRNVWTPKLKKVFQLLLMFFLFSLKGSHLVLPKIEFRKFKASDLKAMIELFLLAFVRQTVSQTRLTSTVIQAIYLSVNQEKTAF